MSLRRPSSQPDLVAVDTGGTFTDFFVLTAKGLRTHKVLSTPRDPSQAILRGLKDLGLRGNFELVHGSTVATNAFLERKGARVALLTTAGFEDVLEIGRQNRPQLYHLDTHRTLSLVPAKFRFGVEERISAQGKILQPLDSHALRRLLDKIKGAKVDSIAVCLLFSYANPKHEAKLRRHLKPLKKFLSFSTEICPEYREYERTSTTCINAYVAPVMARYLTRLQRKLPERIRIMQSNGGSLSIKEASRDAVHTLLSGPAGGALGAFQVARRAGYPKVLSLDMGGTSTDLSLMDGALELTSEAQLGGFPVKTPMIRIDTIGAGGGSLAWRDQGGALRVGPQSAGALPGPICYGRGGRKLTITDAHVFLGRLPPRHFLGGRMPLYPEKIRKPMTRLAGQLRLSQLEAADGILTVANANMARALRVLSLERGYDPRDFTLLPFGGAGALHACELAGLLGIPRVLVPANPGILSAYGMAHADWVRDYVRTLLVPEGEKPNRKIQRALGELKKRAWEEAAREGHGKIRVQFKTALDLRYRGQSYELTVPLSHEWRRNFERAHLKQYGFLHRNQEMEVVNVRLQARVPWTRKTQEAPQQSKVGNAIQAVESLRLYWKKQFYTAQVWLRETLTRDHRLSGPAVVAEFSATTFVPPGWQARCDPFLNLILTPKRHRRPG